MCKTIVSIMPDMTKSGTTKDKKALKYREKDIFSVGINEEPKEARFN